MTKPKTPDYVLRAVKRYDKKAKKVQIVFNLDKPAEAELYDKITADKSTPLSQLAKMLLAEYYEVK